MDKHIWRAVQYGGLAAFFFIGLHFASRPATGEFVRLMSESTAVGALFAALFTLFRDNIAHERTLLVKESEYAFSIGATSHIASVAFDKHVEFCEGYVSAVIDVTSQLLRIGPKPEAIDFAQILSDVRRKWIVWLNPDLDAKLDKFESAINSIGADAWLLKEDPSVENRAQLIRSVHNTYKQVLGFQGVLADDEVVSERTVRGTVDSLRKLLGIQELTELRLRLVGRASAKPESI
jgi:hypothetical protein